MGFVRQTATLLWKDVVVELRAKELIYACLLFAAVLVLVFAFAFLGGERPGAEVSAGALWVTIALAGTLGIGRAFEREREGDTLRALLLAPSSRAALYLAKLTAICLLMVIIEVVAVALIALLFAAPVAAELPLIALLLALGTLGFAAVAALFGASLGRARSREVLLPLLTWPLVVPVLIAGTRATAELLGGEARASALFWLKFLLVFDCIFVTLGLWVFEPIVGGEG
jgi:heme exporter protein CcmB